MTPETQRLVTIDAHRGLYEVTRLSFGVKTVPAIVQRMMGTMLSGLPGVSIYLDDIIVTGNSADSQYDRLKTVLQCLSAFWLRLCKEKCRLFMNEIKYLGIIFGADGHHSDPENVKVLQQIPAPKDVSSQRAFFGLINHYNVFLPEFYRIRSKLNKLLQKEQT